ncbi:hypothetical protein [Sphingomonas sp. G-3-2-10]|uniref:hypothetical protein n=1 Tax=Sphingomonas sp. G-3-2-10 TaxID=2728838 RepID=UPI00146D79C1|nr:hypothetical protein [Sphingomonas sp. G-3-2-10]NML04439.1 hypothetical protein [Sphingomonas sp. G-3-2-10]
MRPNSIVQFERLFLVQFAINIVVQALTWTSSVAALARRAKVAEPEAMLYLAVFVAVVLLLQLALWYFAARRRSVIAKWILSIWFVLGTAQLALQTFQLGFSFSVPSLLSWAGFLIYAWAVSYLFKPDADEWFAKR